LTNGAPLGLKALKSTEGEEKEICKKIITMFGASGADAEELSEIGASRLSFADSPLDEEWKKNALVKHQPYTEVKSENSINRIKGTAENPRFTERVPADTKFSFCIALKVFDQDDDLEKFLLKGLKLLEMDSLGGSGSRGYGKIKFEFDNAETRKLFEQADPLS